MSIIENNESRYSGYLSYLSICLPLCPSIPRKARIDFWGHADWGIKGQKKMATAILDKSFEGYEINMYLFNVLMVILLWTKILRIKIYKKKLNTYWKKLKENIWASEFTVPPNQALLCEVFSRLRTVRTKCVLFMLHN